MAGTISDTLIHPLDVVKTRQQAQLTNLAKNKYISILQSFRRILAEEGVRGVYSGVRPAILGSLASHTLYFGVYEATKRELLQADLNPLAAYFLAGKYY